MVLAYYPTILGEDKKVHVNKAIMNNLYENIDFRNRRLISEFPGD